MQFVQILIMEIHLKAKSNNVYLWLAFCLKKVSGGLKVFYTLWDGTEPTESQEQGLSIRAFSCGPRIKPSYQLRFQEACRYSTHTGLVQNQQVLWLGRGRLCWKPPDIGYINSNPGDKGEQATEQAAQLQCYKLHV